MTQPPLSGLAHVLRLRALSLAAFPLGAGLMALLQRSPLALSLLAAVMLAVSLYERRRLAGLAGIQPAISGAQVLLGFAFRLGLLIGVFVIVLGLSALFRDTSLSREVALLDLGLAALPAAIALGANEISARLAARSLAGLEAGPTASHHPRGYGDASGEGIVIEGEVIEPGDPPPRG
ncbi:hypothetical protein [Hyphomonas sp.]|uniref:hypothetical protein n=1 Tax=Hyphomonas sp. TaxID=87 RepID=UPI00391DD4DC